MKTSILAFLFILPLISMAQKKGCVERRAVFDIGSGSSKMKVFDFDKCQKKVLKEVESVNRTNCSYSRKVSYRKDYETHQKLSSRIISRGKRVLREMYKRSKKCGATKIAAVATSAFRVAPNGNEALKALSKIMNTPIKKISHREEAILGYKSAIYHQSLQPSKKVCSWDIGGSSMQIVCFHDNGRYETYLGKLASVSFMGHILKLQKSQSLSPNPISSSIASKASAYAKSYARKTVSPMIKNLFRRGAKVIGIGGVHAYAIASSYSLKSYRKDQLRKIYKERLGKTDQELISEKLIPKKQSPYLDTAISNVILVQAFMEALNIRRVLPSKASIIEGVLLSPSFWI